MTNYWFGAAEDVIKNIEKASSEDSKKMTKKIMSKRMLKAMGHTNPDPSGLATKDILLMQKVKIYELSFFSFLEHKYFLNRVNFSSEQLPS